MSDNKRRLKVLLMHAILLPTLLFVLNFFALSPFSRIESGDSAAGKSANFQGLNLKSLVDETSGGAVLPLLLLGAGVVAGFAAGYWWRSRPAEKNKP